MKIYIPTCIIVLLLSTNVQAQEVMHLTNNALVSIKNNAVLTIAGGITIENGSTLVNNGVVTLLKNSSGGSSDLIDNTTTGYNYGTGIFVLNSNSGKQQPYFE